MHLSIPLFKPERSEQAAWGEGAQSCVPSLAENTAGYSDLKKKLEPRKRNRLFCEDHFLTQSTQTKLHSPLGRAGLGRIRPKELVQP